MPRDNMGESRKRKRDRDELHQQRDEPSARGGRVEPGPSRQRPAPSDRGPAHSAGPQGMNKSIPDADTRQGGDTQNSARQHEGRSRSGPFDSRDSTDQIQDIAFDHYWTRSDEEKLQAGWTTADQTALERTPRIECSVWRKARLVFDKSLPDLIPTHMYPGGDGKDIVNWGSGIASSFSKLICCPAFKRNEEFLVFCLRKAMYYRVGGARPTLCKSSRRNRDIIARFEQKLDAINASLFETARTALDETLDEVLGVEVLPHYAFQQGLRRAVRSYSTPRGVTAGPQVKGPLVKRDVDAVCNAWDEYCKSNPGLLTIDAAAQENAWERPGMGSHKSNVLMAKKQFVLNCRREAMRAQIEDEYETDLPSQDENENEDDNEDDDVDVDENEDEDDEDDDDDDDDEAALASRRSIMTRYYDSYRQDLPDLG